MSNAEFKIAVVLSMYDKMSASMNKATAHAQNKLQGLSKASSKVADSAFKNGQQLVAGGLALAAPLYKSVQAATEFESKMIDIRKQMNNDTPEGVMKMTDEINKLGRTVPLATSEIQDMIASGLRMGIAEDKVVDYTKQVAKMSVAFDMSAGEIADSMGKIAGVYKIPIEKIGDFADAINYLDDKTQAKGPELVDVLLRVGGAAKNLPRNSVAAMAATMLTLGETAETSGTSMAAMFNTLGAATMQSKKFQGGMKMLGLDAANLQKLMSDPSTAQGAMMDVFERIQKLPVEKQTEALIRLFGKDHGPKLMKLANNTKMLAENIKLVSGAEKGSMNNEYQKRVQSTEAQMQLLKNSFQEMVVAVGTELLPIVKDLAQKFAGWAQRMSAFVKEHKEAVVMIAKVVAVLSAIALVGGYVSLVVGGVARMISFAATAGGFLVKVFNVLVTIFRVVWFLLQNFPLFRVIALVILLAVLIYKYWTPIKEFVKKLWGSISENIVGYLNFLKGIFFGLVNVLTWPFRQLKKYIMMLLPDFKKAGSNIIDSLWNGIKAVANKPIELMRKIVGKIRNFLPFSPAKDGPLKDIHRIKLVETIAATIKPDALVNSMRRVAGATRDAIFPKTAGVVGARAATTGGGGVTFNITLHGGATQADATMLSTEIKKQFTTLMKGHEAQKTRIKY